MNAQQIRMIKELNKHAVLTAYERRFLNQMLVKGIDYPLTGKQADWLSKLHTKNWDAISKRKFGRSK
jgi:hypothetical protein